MKDGSGYFTDKKLNKTTASLLIFFSIVLCTFSLYINIQIGIFAGIILVSFCILSAYSSRYLFRKEGIYAEEHIFGFQQKQWFIEAENINDILMVKVEGNHGTTHAIEIIAKNETITISDIKTGVTCKELVQFLKKKYQIT